MENLRGEIREPTSDEALLVILGHLTAPGAVALLSIEGECLIEYGSVEIHPVPDEIARSDPHPDRPARYLLAPAGAPLDESLREGSSIVIRTDALSTGRVLGIATITGDEGTEGVGIVIGEPVSCIVLGPRADTATRR